MGGNEGGEADHTRDGAADSLDDDLEPESWPGLESLPPSPPHEYPPPRRYSRRRRSTEAGLLPERGVPGDGAVGSEARTPLRPSRRWPLIAAVAAVVLLLLAVPAIYLSGRTSAEPDAALGTTTTTAPSESTTTTAAGPPTESSSTTSTSSTTTSTLPPIVAVPDPPLDEAVVEVSAFVAEQRGLDYGGPVSAVRLPDAEFEARVREREASKRRAIEAEGSFLKLQGLFPEDEDYVEHYLQTYPTLVGAYYDPITKGVVARGEPGSPVTPDAKVMLAHELTHALDDRAFDLFSRVYDDPYLEQWFGLLALNEGDAQRIENLWAARHAQPGHHPSVADEDDIVAAQFTVVYELGEKLVAHIVARGGEAELNASFADPPSTSEQVMHPEKYAVREPPMELDKPIADGSPLWEGVTGEYTTGLMLSGAIPLDNANRAAAGWGGDKGVLWVQPPDEGGLTCLRIAYVMDTPEDLAELEDAFANWIAAAPNRTGVRDAPDRLVITSCADVPPPPPDYGNGGSPA